jgi:uncharacterized protein
MPGRCGYKRRAAGLPRPGCGDCMTITYQPDLLIKPSGRTAMLLSSGFVLDLLNPDATGMPISDVARSLSQQPRWAGATKAFFSVAEHSVMVSKLVPPEFAFDGLMHDADEMISGDIASCVKVLIGRDRIKAALKPVLISMSAWFGFRLDVPQVKVADTICMATELRDLLPPAWMDWGHLLPPVSETIVPVGPAAAYELFMARYEEVKHLALKPGPGRKQKRHRARHETERRSAGGL